jgi:hypothetical protein
VSDRLNLASAHTVLTVRELEPQVNDGTLGILLKYRGDIRAVGGKLTGGLP